jgi:hypothetical protein
MEDLDQYVHARDLWVKAVDEASDRMKTSEVSRNSTKMQQIIDDYKNSTDDSLKKYVEDVIAGKHTEKSITVLRKVSDDLASSIDEAIGVKPVDYTVELRDDEVRHILKRHGINGIADHSMKDVNDIARIGYILNNYDEVVPGSKKSRAFKNSDGTPAEAVEITKKIGRKIYHVIEAVPISKFNKLNTITAFIENIKVEDAIQGVNTTNSPDHNVRNALETTSSIKNIAPAEENNNENAKNYQLNIDDAQMESDGTVSHKARKKLSGSGLAEQTGTLIAVHNIDATKLDSLLGYDSIPMPSIAITKADMGWNEFGDVSFIFRKDTVDPKKDKRNRVYGADAWTPTFPTIENDVDEDVKYRAYDTVKKTMNGTEPSFLEEQAKNFVSTRSADIAESSGMDELIKRASEDYGMKAAYLASKGITVNDHTEEVQEANISDSQISLYQDMVKEFGQDLKGANKIPIKDILDQYGSRIQKVYRENMLKNGVPEDLAEKRANSLLKRGTFGKYPRAVTIFTAASDYMDKGVQYTTRTVRDEDAVHKEIDSHIDAAGLNKWLEGLFSGMVKGTGIYNGRDYFTSSGNRRSFAQTHYSVTPENIVRAMVSRQQGEGKSAAVTPGIKGIIAAGSKEYHSVEDIHKDESRIQNLTKEEMNEAVHGLDQRLEALERKIQDQSSYKSYSSIDTIHEAIAEASEKKRVTDATIQKAFDYYGWIKATPEDITEIQDIIKEARKVPVDMFEAKPERTVDYSEVAHVLVPNTLSPEYRERLAARGLDIIEYDPEIDGDRLEKMRSLDDIRFQLDIDDASVPDDL